MIARLCGWKRQQLLRGIEQWLQSWSVSYENTTSTVCVVSHACHDRTGGTEVPGKSVQKLSKINRRWVMNGIEIRVRQEFYPRLRLAEQTIKAQNEVIVELRAEIKQLKNEREPVDYEAGWYWADYDGLRQIGIAEDGEVWFVGYYEPVPLSECEDISLITDPKEAL
jgi:hypothetical protein